ncbi:MAG TPA: thiamine diphosphokinase [Anaerolineaceae bacterium]|nr:thiamine diphosphokinase [Anaerolineaceae bacterium]
MTEDTILIFANGELTHPEAVLSLATTAKIIIAVDGGLAHIQALGLQPDMLIGDLDSVSPEQIRWAEEQGSEVRRFPVNKNETDLELALLAAAETGCRHIVIVAALGGRLDQTLSNIFLLNLPVLADLDVRIDDGKQEVILIHSAADLQGNPGDTISLLPISPIVRGITTTGLQYPLTDESLIFYRSRGISNEMLSSRVHVEIQSGILICIHERKGELK